MGFACSVCATCRRHAVPVPRGALHPGVPNWCRAVSAALSTLPALRTVLVQHAVVWGGLGTAGHRIEIPPLPNLFGLAGCGGKDSWYTGCGHVLTQRCDAWGEVRACCAGTRVRPPVLRTLISVTAPQRVPPF
jgi:hypothetical protein